MNRILDLFIVVVFAIIASVTGALSYFGNTYTLIGLVVFAATLGYLLSAINGSVGEQLFTALIVVISAIVGSWLKQDDPVNCLTAATLGLCGFALGIFIENFGKSYPASNTKR